MVAPDLGVEVATWSLRPWGCDPDHSRSAPELLASALLAGCALVAAASGLNRTGSLSDGTFMASGYKLRLGDGTTVLVDDKGLATWLQGGLVDEKARVQPAGSKQWLTIRQLLVAMERAMRARQVEEDRLTAQRRVTEERAEAEHREAEERAAVERLAEERLAAEQAVAEERAEAERRAAEARAAVERLAEERLEAERAAAKERRVAERRADQ